MINLAFKGKRIVLDGSEEDLYLTVVDRMPYDVLTRSELEKEIRRIVGEHHGPINIKKIREVYGTRLFPDSSLFASLLFANNLVEELRKKHGLIIKMDKENILKYLIKTNVYENGIPFSTPVEMVFNKSSVVFNRWRLTGPEFCGSIEYLDPKFNAEGVFNYVQSNYRCVFIDHDYDIKMLQSAKQQIDERMKEISDEGN
jgi:hypothetical protein